MGCFYGLRFAKFAPKIFSKLADFSANLSLNILRNLTFFHDLLEARIVWRDPSDLKIPWIEVGVNLEVNWLCL